MLFAAISHFTLMAPSRIRVGKVTPIKEERWQTRLPNAGARFMAHAKAVLPPYDRRR